MKMCQDGTGVVTTFGPISTFVCKTAIVVVVSALLSTLAFLLMAFRIVRDATINRNSRPRKIMFFRTQLGHYAGCLLLSNMLISAAGLINLNWLTHSGLNRGSACLAQAILMQIGIWGTCWFTVAHGLHSLVSLVFCIRQIYWNSAVTASVGWIIAIVAALVPMKKDDMYGPVGISCSITSSYREEIFLLQALPFILGAFVMTTVYSLTFIALRRKQKTSNERTLRSLSSTHRGGGSQPVAYHRFISIIIWTMFWFPLAFILLMLPLCITRILVYAGCPVSIVLNVIADGCVSLLGLVNVGLLFNTLRVIGHMSHVARIAAETMTFGHDASSESPTGSHFHSQSAVPSLTSSEGTSGSNGTSHSHSSSCSSVDSNTGLLCGEKASYEFTRTKPSSLALHIIPPAELSRQLDNEPDVTSPASKAKRNGVHFGIVNSRSRTVSLSVRPPPVGRGTGGTKHKPSTQDEKYSSEPVADTQALGKGVGELCSRSNVPLKVDLSSLPYPVTAAFSTQKAYARPPMFPLTQIPRTEVHISSPKDAESIRRSCSTSSYSSIGTLGTDTDSDYSGELMHAYKVRLHSRALQPNDDESTNGFLPLDPRRRSSLARRLTVSTIWSQESESMTDDEFQEAYWQLIADMLGDLEVMLGDQTDVARGITRQSTFGLRGVRPITLRVQPKVRLKSSVHFSDALPLENKLWVNHTVV